MMEYWMRAVIWFFWISGAGVMFVLDFTRQFLYIGWIGYTVLVGIDIFGFVYGEYKRDVSQTIGEKKAGKG